MAAAAGGGGGYNGFAPVAPFITAAEHDLRVAKVLETVRARPAGPNAPLLSVRKGKISHSVRDWKYKENTLPVDVTHLTGIVSITPVDAKADLTPGEQLAIASPAMAEAVKATAAIAHVEGQVNMGQLTQAALKHGYMPLVVPEYQTFTVSGLINGGGIQSTCHRYGLFRNSVASMEVVLGNGELVVASPDSYGDLYYSMFDLQGTFGVVTGARIRLMKAKPFVRTEYRHYTDFDTYFGALKARLSQYRFLEGLIFGPKSFVLLTGEYADAPATDDDKQLQYNACEPGLPWFYQHAENMALANTDAIKSLYPKTDAAIASASAKHRAARDGAAPYDFMPTDHYVARYMRGAWWLIPCITGNPPILTHTQWGRKWLDEKTEKHVQSGGLRGKWPEEMRERCMALQDLGCSFDKLKHCVEFVQRELNLYPLWNQPIAPDPMSWRDYVRRVVSPAEAEECGFDAVKLRRALNADSDPNIGVLVDVGIWGEPMVPDYRNRKTMRIVQKELGFPSCWGVSYLTREEMRTFVYDEKHYNAIRKKYHADGAFNHLEDKVLFFDPNAPDLGKPSFWRDRRSIAAGQIHFVLLKWGLRLILLLLVLYICRGAVRLVRG